MSAAEPKILAYAYDDHPATRSFAHRATTTSAPSYYSVPAAMPAQAQAPFLPPPPPPHSPQDYPPPHAGSSSAQGLSAKKKYSCTMCGRGFTTSGHLARHTRIHTGERNHACPFPGCETRCSRQDNLQQHYRIHLSPGSRRTTGHATRAAMHRAMDQQSRRSASVSAPAHADTPAPISVSVSARHPAPPASPKDELKFAHTLTLPLLAPPPPPDAPPPLQCAYTGASRAPAPARASPELRAFAYHDARPAHEGAQWELRSPAADPDGDGDGDDAPSPAASPAYPDTDDAPSPASSASSHQSLPPAHAHAHAFHYYAGAPQRTQAGFCESGEPAPRAVYYPHSQSQSQSQSQAHSYSSSSSASPTASQPPSPTWAPSPVGAYAHGHGHGYADARAGAFAQDGAGPGAAYGALALSGVSPTHAHARTLPALALAHPHPQQTQTQTQSQNQAPRPPQPQCYYDRAPAPAHAPAHAKYADTTLAPIHTHTHTHTGSPRRAPPPTSDAPRRDGARKDYDMDADAPGYLAYPPYSSPSLADHHAHAHAWAAGALPPRTALVH